MGDAEFGDERATVGAIVEATGADAATVLRILGEIRHRAIVSQQAALQAVERRVARLEQRPVEQSYRSHSRTTSDQSPAEQDEHFGKKLVTVFCAGLALFVFFLALFSKGTDTSSRDDGPTYSTDVSDGRVTMYPDNTIEVIRHDGTMRAPTPDEEAMLLMLRAQPNQR